MSSRFSLEAVISMIDNVSNPMGKATNSVLGFSKKMQAGFGAASSSSSGFGSVIKGILGAAVIQSAISGFTNLAFKAVQLASDMVEVQNVVDVTFGKMSGRINEFAKTALEKFGLSELQAKKFSSTFGAMLKSSGIMGEDLFLMSTRLTGLVGDFASFYNLDHETAFQKLRAGISGETEPLKQLGIDMSVANLQAFMLTKGITQSWESMDAAKKAMVRYNFILKTSADAQGDFARTLDTSYANQKRLFDTKFNEFLAKMATQSLPLLIDVFKALNSAISGLDPVAMGNKIKTVLEFLITSFKSLYQFVKRNETAFKIIGTILGVVAIAILFMAGTIAVSLIPSLIAANTTLFITKFIIAAYTIAGWAASIATTALSAATWLMTAASAALGISIGWIVIILIALVAAGVLVYQNWDTIKAVGLQVFDVLKSALFSFAYVFTYMWFGIIDAVLAGADKVGNALGINGNKIQVIRQEMSSIQADIFARSGFASPNSQGQSNNINGNINVNVSSPAGSNTETTTSGAFGGMKLNTGVDKG